MLGDKSNFGNISIGLEMSKKRLKQTLEMKNNNE